MVLTTAAAAVRMTLTESASPLETNKCEPSDDSAILFGCSATLIALPTAGTVPETSMTLTVSPPWLETYAFVPSFAIVTQKGRCPAATVSDFRVAVSASVTALPS